MSHERKGCAPEDVEACLREAAQLSKQRGGNLTPLREKVLKLLLKSERPVKAYDLLGQLKDDREAKPPTVYRALDFLVEMGLAHKIASLQAFVPCRHWSHAHTPALLLCKSCGMITELDADDVAAKLTGEAASVAFASRSALIEVHGTCPDCHL